MSSSAVMKVTMVILACMLVSAPYAEAISCGQIAGSLIPCVTYLRSGGALSPGCCQGVKTVNGLARSTPDRQAACKCLKSLASGGVKPNLAASLPGKCGVRIPYPINNNVDCSKVT